MSARMDQERGVWNGRLFAALPATRLIGRPWFRAAQVGEVKSRKPAAPRRASLPDGRLAASRRQPLRSESQALKKS